MNLAALDWIIVIGYLIASVSVGHWLFGRATAVSHASGSGRR
jgi:hypothetical protein